VLPGDTLSIINIAGGTPATSAINSWSISAENFYPGESLVAGSTTDPTSTTPSFIRIKNSSASAESATASDVHRRSVGPTHVLKDFILWDKTATRQTAPNFLTNEIYIGLAKNGVLDTNTTATLGKSELTQRIGTSLPIVEGDNLSVTFDSFIGSPTAATAAHAFTQYIQPTFFTPVSITESVTVEYVGPVAFEVNVFEALSITEDVTTSVSITQSVFEVISIAETTQLNKQNFASLFDAVAITESTQTLRSVSFLVSDLITIVDTAQGSTDLIPVENITISELVTVQLGTLQVSLVDTITISENQSLVKIHLLSLFETVGIAESQSLFLAYAQSVFDAITIAESRTIGPLQQFISVADAITIVDSASTFIRYEINTSDAITINESTSSSIAYIRNVFDSLSIAESVSVEKFVLSRQLPGERYQGSMKRINMKTGGSI
jgi:hypothetical protein